MNPIYKLVYVLGIFILIKYFNHKFCSDVQKQLVHAMINLSKFILIQETPNFAVP